MARFGGSETPSFMARATVKLDLSWVVSRDYKMPAIVHGSDGGIRKSLHSWFVLRVNETPRFMGRIDGKVNSIGHSSMNVYRNSPVI